MMNKNLLTAGVITAIAGASLIACGGGSVTSAGPTPAGPLPAAVPAAASFTVKVLGFNDYHGNLEAFGTFGETSSVPATQRSPVGGADFLAAHIARLKAQNPNNVVVAAGDNIGASPLISSLFLDEPAVETLKHIGLDFTSVGNHEFDKGSAELLRLQNGSCKTTAGVQDTNSCRSAAVGTPVPFEGAKYQWLSANVIQTSTGKPLLPAYGLKTFNGVRVKSCSKQAPSHRAGWAPLHGAKLPPGSSADSRTTLAIVVTPRPPIFYQAPA